MKLYLKKKERKKLWGKGGNIEGKEHINRVRKQEYAIFYVIESKMCSFLKRVKVGEVKKQKLMCNNIVGRASF